MRNLIVYNLCWYTLSVALFLLLYHQSFSSAPSDLTRLVYYWVGEETIQEKQITGEANAKKNDYVKLFEKEGGGHGHKMLGLLNTVQKCRLP